MATKQNTRRNKRLKRGRRRQRTAKNGDDFALRIKGKQEHAVRGLLDGGFRFTCSMELKNPSFNGCRQKKVRRR